MKRGRITYNAPVVLTFTLLAGLVLLLNTLTGGAVNSRFFTVYRGNMLSPLFYWRLFSHVLGHSGFAHYVGNFTYILLLGPTVEEKYGSRRLLLMMLGTAGLTGVLQVVFFPQTGLLGASGIVYLLIVLSSATNFQRGEIPLTLIIVTVFFIGGQVYAGLTAADTVSQFAHIVGGLAGGVLGLIWGAKDAPDRRRKQNGTL